MQQFIHSYLIHRILTGDKFATYLYVLMHVRHSLILAHLHLHGHDEISFLRHVRDLATEANRFVFHTKFILVKF